VDDALWLFYSSDLLYKDILRVARQPEGRLSSFEFPLSPPDPTIPAGNPERDPPATTLKLAFNGVQHGLFPTQLPPRSIQQDHFSPLCRQK
jgi:hypothetical protein